MTVERRLKRLVAENLCTPVDYIHRCHEFVRHLYADSLDTVVLVMACEEEFGIRISDRDAETLTTVGQAIDYIEGRLR